jgi:hypothetical protein
MFNIINRNAVIITPKQALLDWVSSKHGKGGSMKLSEDGHDESNVYLIPEMECIEDNLMYLNDNYRIYFEDMLREWVEDKNLWPKKLTWSLFTEWFSFSVQSMVIDTGFDDIV